MDLDADLDIRPVTAFAHASEAELARILDFYAVAWEYEPRTFPILFDRSGTVLESFSPDFYLPELDVYLELTTLKQRLVRKKNRKLRRLRELYPGIRIKLLYARDFRALLFKYGKLALADALTGADGQTTPPKPRPQPPALGPQTALGPQATLGAASAGVASGHGSPAAPAIDRGPITGPGVGVPGRADRARRRTRRTRAEARARVAARVSPAGQPASVEITA